MFARVQIEHDVLQAGLVRLVPSASLIAQITIQTSSATGSAYLSLVTPGRIGGSVPPPGAGWGPTAIAVRLALRHRGQPGARGRARDVDPAGESQGGLVPAAGPVRD